MKKPQIVYIHGGDAFDSFFEGAKNWGKNVVLKRLFFWKRRTKKWPDSLAEHLPEFEVIKLKMPAKYNAQYAAWARQFECQFPTFEDGIMLVGWSLGANFLAKYLAENEMPVRVKAVHLIAGCYGLDGGFWLLENFPGKLKEYVVCLYHSRDDFVVDFKDFEQYRQALPAAKTYIFTNRNHFLQPDFPELIENLKNT